MEREHIDVLLIEDDKDDVFIVRHLLENARTVDCNLTWRQSYEEGLEAILSEAYDVAIVDYRLGRMSGLDLLKAAQEHDCTTPLIVLTGQGSPEVDLQAMQGGAADYLSKEGFDTELLERAIRYAHQRARSERAIRHQAALLDEAQDAICAYDLEGSVTYWSEGAARMTGYAKEEIGNLHTPDCLYEVVDKEALEHAWEVVLQEGHWSGELTQKTNSGDTIIVKSRWSLVRNAKGEPQTILIINTDITERKRLEQQALRSQRMESIGRLVGGIAHDLGNLLVPIQLGVSILKSRHADNEDTLRNLQMIEKSAERGADMVERVLSFARGVEGERQPLSLSDIIEEVEQLVEESFPKTITFEAQLPEALPPVCGDATQLQQVLVNLSVNARDAMPDGGRLTFEVQEVRLADGDVRLAPDASPGRYVHVRVCDTGMGIPPEALGKIFEPFFSTKDADDGTGLGLSTVYSIVNSHDGFVDVQSTVGQGTSFDIFLPATEEKAADEEDLADAPADAPAQNRDEKVLVVDDETFVRESAEAVLADLGYRPLTTDSLEEALQLFEERSVEAVISDASLEGTDERKVVRAFKSRRSAVPVIVCSHRADSQLEKARAAGADYFLSKPFDAQALREALDAVLATRRETHGLEQPS